MRKILAILLLLLPAPAFATTYLLNGGLQVGAAATPHSDIVGNGKGVFPDSLRAGPANFTGDCNANWGKWTARDSIATRGPLMIGFYAFSALPTVGNGSSVYCSDCKKTSPATSGGTGSWVFRENGAWNSSSTDTTGLPVRAGREPGQTIFGRDRGYASGKGFDLRGFTDSGTQDSTANLTLDMDGAGQGTFSGFEFDLLPKTQTKGWKATLSVANNRASVVHDGEYTLQPTGVGNAMRILMANGTNSMIPIEVQAKSGSTAAQTAWQNSSGTKVAYIDSIWGVKATRIIAYDSLRVVRPSDLGGILQNGWGFKHARVTTGSVSAASTALVTVTWTTAFADANYTVQASVLDATTSSLSLSVVHVESVTASAVTVRVLNNAAGSLTGTLHVVAIHD